MGVLGDSASRLGKPLGAELVPGSGVRAQRPRGPRGDRVPAGRVGAGPRELPRLRASPSIPQTSPASPSHGITTSASRLHMQAACMASLLHRPAPQPEPPRPGSCGFSSWHLWEPSARCSKGEWVLAGSGSGGHFPRVLAGVRTPDTWPTPWEGRAGATCSLPWGGGHRTTQALPSLIGRALCSLLQIGTTSGVVERQQRTPTVLRGRERPCQSATGGGSQPCPQQPHPTEPQ